MKKFILPVIALLVLVLVGVYFYTQKNKPTETVHERPSITKEFQNYNNSTYHFSMIVPKEIYSINCKTSELVDFVERGNVITIGAKFNCPEQDPNSLQGYTLYASNNISSEQDAKDFVRKAIGSDCTVEEWDGSRFIIGQSKGEEAALNEVNCPILGGKTKTQYSPEHKTAVVWSLGQEYEFYKADGGNYDEEVSNSFRFVE